MTTLLSTYLKTIQKCLPKKKDVALSTERYKNT